MFGAGFVAGHYFSVDPGAKTETTAATGQPGERFSSAAPTTPDQAGYPGNRAPRSRRDGRLPIPGQSPSEIGTASSHPAWPAYASRLEEQAEWEEHQRAIREGELAELDTVIQSLEAAGRPDIEIEPFRAQRKERAKAPLDEFQAWPASPPERSAEELKADFAASLEPTDIPETGRQALLKLLSGQFAPDESQPDPWSAALPAQDTPD
jgi:hypothetical protein